MPEIIAFVSPKGGCGASTLCAHMWNNLAQMGKKVLAADLCFSKCTLDFVLGMQNDSVFDIADAACGRCSIEDAVCVSQDNADAHFLRGSEEKFEIENFRQEILKSDYDFVLLDIPSNDFETEKYNGTLWNKMIVVTDCTQISVKLCGKFLENTDTKNVYAVINKIIPAYIQSGILLNVDEILDSIGIYPIGLIPWSFDIIAKSASGISVIDADKLTEQALENTARRILGEHVPALDFNKVNVNLKKQKSFIKK